MTEIPTDPVAAARVARDALEAAAAHQSVDPDPDHGQFYNHGRELVGVLIALDDLAVTLAGRVTNEFPQLLLASSQLRCSGSSPLRAAVLVHPRHHGDSRGPAPDARITAGTVCVWCGTGLQDRSSPNRPTLEGTCGRHHNGVEQTKRSGKHRPLSITLHRSLLQNQ